jgi:hypothetical protein
MIADRTRSRLAPVAASCSVVAAAVFGALPALSAVSPSFNPAHPWLFGLGAAAFASNLVPHVHPILRAAAALAQAMCLFELLGFSVAVTIMSYSFAARWPMMDAWQWLATWGLFGVCCAGLVLSILVRRSSPPR